MCVPDGCVSYTHQQLAGACQLRRCPNMQPLCDSRADKCTTCCAAIAFATLLLCRLDILSAAHQHALPSRPALSASVSDSTILVAGILCMPVGSSNNSSNSGLAACTINLWFDIKSTPAACASTKDFTLGPCLGCSSCHQQQRPPAPSKP